MAEAIIRRINEINDTIGEFIHNEFTRFGEQNGVALRYDEFCFAAEDSDGKIRRSGLGKRLVGAVEETYRGRGYDVITLTTFGFQAPEFYRKLGYTVEFVRESKDPKLCKYFLKKEL